MHGPLIIDVVGTTLTEEDIQRLSHPLVGGVILFSRNIVDAQQVMALVSEIRTVAPSLLISVDQEGGRVQRLREGFTALPPMANLGKQYDRAPDAALGTATLLGWLMAAEVKAVGIDLSYAPVLDLQLGASDVIGDRALHADPLVVSRLATAYLVGMQSAGMASVGKHFPGHGFVSADSHHALPVDERSLEEILRDAGSFFGVSQLLTAVMPAHILHPQIDKVPTTFSTYWLNDILRTHCQFNGLVISDDLSMVGAKFYDDINQAFDCAMTAGCDFCLLCNDPETVDTLLVQQAEGCWVMPRQDKIDVLRGEESAWTLEQLRETARWQQAQAAKHALEQAVAA